MRLIRFDIFITLEERTKGNSDSRFTFISISFDGNLSYSKREIEEMLIEIIKLNNHHKYEIV